MRQLRAGRSAWRRAAIVVGAGALVIVAGACTPLMTTEVNGARTMTGHPALATNPSTTSTAATRAQALCTAGAINASPTGTYGEGTSTAVHELVGSASLAQSATTASGRDVQATKAIWAQWAKDPEILSSQWTNLGVGQSMCADGNLYMTAVLSGAQRTLPTGRYSTAIYDPSTIRKYLGIQYTTAVDYTGTTIPLLLDVYLPPAGAPGPRPTIVLIHGGAFVGGSRSDMSGVASYWAIRGYDVVSIDYRLDQSLYQDSSPPKEVAAATNATLDAEEAVRWIKANASTYSFDTTRIAAVGYSAGGGISLGMAAAPDIVPNGPYSSTIASAISTGAYLTPALDLGVLHLTPGLAPILMFHYETDVASNTGVYAYRTCSAYRAAGSQCDYVSQAGEGHTTDLTPGSVWWANQIGPFVFQSLRLG